MARWVKMSGLEKATTKKVQGDKTVMQTKWWNYWYLILFGWRAAVMFEIHEVPPGGFYVGYRDSWGRVYIREQPVEDRRFAMLVGHEDCEFFALDMPVPAGDNLEFIQVSRMSKAAAKKAGIRIL